MKVHSMTSSMWRFKSTLVILILLAMLTSSVYARLPSTESGNPDAKRLYDDLLSNYNKLVRPVVNTTDPLTVRIKLKLSQLIDVNLKNQIMTTNLWVEQFWFDYKLVWDPVEYGGVQQLHVPSDHIWRPDIVLYNNADGNFEVTLATKATLWYNGLVEWKPPAIYKSSCEIDVEYFPFDEQTCVMKFGSWTYDGFQVDLRHMCEIEGSNVVDLGIDLSEMYLSVEWDILEVPAVRNEKFYTCCDEPYLDITFNITMRRKTLFYTVNLIIPCMGISFLTVLTFYLPSDSGEKVSLSISILTSLYVFFLLVLEVIPPTSLVVPLLGKYLIFAMILVSLSICVTVVVLNVHFRSPQTHKMAPWVKRVFIHILPRLLIMKRPQFHPDKHTSLRKVMLRTCLDTADTSTKEFPTATSTTPATVQPSQATSYSAEKAIYDNGDIFGNKTTDNTVYRQTIAFTDQIPIPIPEDIPGLPIHRPGEYSPSYDRRSTRGVTTPRGPTPENGGIFYQGGCRVHGTSIILPDEESSKLLGATSNGHLGPNGGHRGHQPDNGPVGRRRRPSLSASVSSSPLAGSPVPPLGPAPPYDHSNCSDRMHKSCACVSFIAEHTKAREEATKVKEDWKYVAMVLDRLFLWIFTLAVCVGTAGIILQAPSLYDERKPIDREISDITWLGQGPQLGKRKKDSSRSLNTC